MTSRPPKKGESLSFEWPQAPPAAPTPPVTATPTPSPHVPVPVPVPDSPSSPPPAETRPEPAPAPPAPEVLTVSQLGRALGRSLERAFPQQVWVEGEVTGARPAPSGHLYFSLKDEEEDASIDVVMYRSSVTPRGRTLVKDGARLKIRGRPTFWSPRGRLQFVGERVEPTGKGALLEALEKLKAKLAAEGLFAPEKKRPLPHEPRVVGVVTSAAGAVIHDIVKVSFRRGGARILLAPAQVQGAGAAESVRRSLRALQRIPEVDVIIVGRGGGSQDDLLAFWDEELVRDVAACRVPVVSAVGHETDVTLVDFAADARAATPSQAAEMVVPDAALRRRLLEERTHRLRRAIHARIQEERVASERLARAFRDPRLLIATAQQRVDDRVQRLSRIMSRRLGVDREALARLAGRLGAAHPRERIARDAGRVAKLHGRLLEHGRARAARDRATLAELAGRLNAMSPLAVLARGYAIATKDGRAVRDAAEVAPGDAVEVRVAEGSFEASVTSTSKAPGPKAGK